MQTEFKNIMFGKLFSHNGIDYIKTNYLRGYFYLDGKKVFKRFKKSEMVEKKYTASIFND